MAAVCIDSSGRLKVISAPWAATERQLARALPIDAHEDTPEIIHTGILTEVR